ncbi:MAG: putative glycoside hydrolase [Clostridia bacterium]|jgi:hypothetical protein
MKKTCTIILLAIAIIITLTACQKPTQTVSPKPSDSVQPTQTEQNSETPSAQPTESSSPEPTQTADPLETARLEREQLELQRKEQDKEFYVPLKPLDASQEKPNGDDIRAMYLVDSVLTKNYGIEGQPDWRLIRCEDNNVQLYKAYVEALAINDTLKINELKYLENSITTLEKIIGTILGTEMNAVVLNIKSGDGAITIPMQSECVKQVQTEAPRFSDAAYLIGIFKSYGIYTIGRVTSFQDDTLAEYNNYQHAIKNPDGSIWLDDNRSAWVDAYDEWVQNYNIAVAKEAALAGFDEINFDYVRFPEGRKWGTYYKQYMQIHGDTRSDEIIHGFLKNAYEALKPYNVNVSADIFGLVARQWDSEDCLKIGQNWYRITTVVDYICPMIYPSHYTTGWYGFEYPDMNPYGMVLGAMKDSIEKNSAFNDNAKVRLWIQDFTAKYLYPADAIYYYGYEQIYGEVRALRELGSFSYMFWNNGVNYDASKYIFPQDQEKYPLKDGDKDPVGRSPADAAKEYLSVLSSTNYLNQYMLFVLTPIDARLADYDEWLENEFPSIKNAKILGYTVNSYTITDEEGKKADVSVTLKYTKGEDISEIYGTVVWKAVFENDIWKIYPVF